MQQTRSVLAQNMYKMYNRYTKNTNLIYQMKRSARDIDPEQAAS